MHPEASRWDCQMRKLIKGDVEEQGCCSLPAVKVMACPTPSHRQQAIHIPETAQASPS